MNVRIPRRAVLGLGPVTLASCGRREPYFGKSTPPRSQTLIYEFAGEPRTLDPAICKCLREVMSVNVLRL